MKMRIAICLIGIFSRVPTIKCLVLAMIILSEKVLMYKKGSENLKQSKNYTEGSKFVEKDAFKNSTPDVQSFGASKVN